MPTDNMRTDNCETCLQFEGTRKMFRVGDRVGVSKILGRGGPAWRPAKILGPSKHPSFQYTIECEDGSDIFRNCTAGHLCSDKAYEKWLKSNAEKLKDKAAKKNTSARAAAGPAKEPPPTARSIKVRLRCVCPLCVPCVSLAAGVHRSYRRMASRTIWRNR